MDLDHGNSAPGGFVIRYRWRRTNGAVVLTTKLLIIRCQSWFDTEASERTHVRNARNKSFQTSQAELLVEFDPGPRGVPRERRLATRSNRAFDKLYFWNILFWHGLTGHTRAGRIGSHGACAFASRPTLNETENGLKIAYPYGRRHAHLRCARLTPRCRPGWGGRGRGPSITPSETKSAQPGSEFRDRNGCLGSAKMKYIPGTQQRIRDGGFRFWGASMPIVSLRAYAIMPCGRLCSCSFLCLPSP